MIQGAALQLAQIAAIDHGFDFTPMSPGTLHKHGGEDQVR